MNWWVNVSDGQGSEEKYYISSIYQSWCDHSPWSGSPPIRILTCSWRAPDVLLICSWYAPDVLLTCSSGSVCENKCLNQSLDIFWTFSCSLLVKCQSESMWENMKFIVQSRKNSCLMFIKSEKSSASSLSRWWRVIFVTFNISQILKWKFQVFSFIPYNDN